MNEVVILGGADDDMLRRHIELDAYSEAAADAFEADLQHALNLIGSNPFIGSGHSHPPFRKWILCDWDMAVFYRPIGGRCFIHAVLSLRQSSETISAILQSRLPP
jgi:plasmid stabilization system protein ParE